MKSIDTKCVQAGYNPQNGEARVFPIYQSTTFSYETPEEMGDLFDLKKSGFFYTRLSNPTLDALEQKITALDGGVGAMACSSGMAAIYLTTLTLASKATTFCRYLQYTAAHIICSMLLCPKSALNADFLSRTAV